MAELPHRRMVGAPGEVLGVSLPPGCAQIPSMPGCPGTVLPGEEGSPRLLMAGPPLVSLRTGSFCALLCQGYLSAALRRARGVWQPPRACLQAPTGDSGTVG